MMYRRYGHCEGSKRGMIERDMKGIDELRYHDVERRDDEWDNGKRMIERRDRVSVDERDAMVERDDRD